MRAARPEDVRPLALRDFDSGYVAVVKAPYPYAPRHLQVRPLALRDFDAALAVVRPSVSPATLKRYREWEAAQGYT